MHFRIPGADLIGTIFLIWLGFVAIAAVLIFGLQRWRRAHPPKSAQTYTKALPRRFATRQSAPRHMRWTRRLRALFSRWARRH